MKYLVYTRVSPKGSSWTANETSVGDQAAQCRAYVHATDPEGEIVDVVTDEFESGASSKRPGWKRIIREVKAGTAAWDVLVVRHLDRFSRSIRDAVNALELLHDNDKHLIATAQGLNSSNPSGRGVINILLSIAQMEREFASERTKMKMVAIARKGGWPSGRPPYGYKRGAKHDNKLYVDSEKSENVRQIFLRYRSGAGPTELARAYGVHKNTVLHILRNRIYLGLICYDGKEYKGKHEAIVPPDLFEAAQRLLPKARNAPRPRAQKYPYILTGLVYCKCGKHMTPASAHGRSKRYHYYRCTDTTNCGQRISAEELEERVLQALMKIELTDKDIVDLLDELRQDVADRQDTAPNLESLERAVADAKERKERLVNLFVDGLVTEDNAGEINAKLSAAREEYNDLVGRAAAARSLVEESPAELESTRQLLRELQSVGEMIAMSRNDPETMRLHMTTWVSEIRLAEDDTWDVILPMPLGSGGKAFETRASGSSKCAGWLPESNPLRNHRTPAT